MRSLFSTALFAATLAFGFAVNVVADDGKFVIGFAQDDMSNDWRAAQVNAVSAALSRYDNVEFIHTDARGDVAQSLR